MLLIGADLNNKSLLIGENDVQKLMHTLLVQMIETFMFQPMFHQNNEYIADAFKRVSEDITMKLKNKQQEAIKCFCTEYHIVSFSPINKPLLFRSAPINNIPTFWRLQNKKGLGCSLDCFFMCKYKRKNWSGNVRLCSRNLS